MSEMLLPRSYISLLNNKRRRKKRKKEKKKKKKKKEKKERKKRKKKKKKKKKKKERRMKEGENSNLYNLACVYFDINIGKRRLIGADIPRKHSSTDLHNHTQLNNGHILTLRRPLPPHPHPHDHAVRSDHGGRGHGAVVAVASVGVGVDGADGGRARLPHHRRVGPDVERVVRRVLVQTESLGVERVVRRILVQTESLGVERVEQRGAAVLPAVTRGARRHAAHGAGARRVPPQAGEGDPGLVAVHKHTRVELHQLQTQILH